MNINKENLKQLWYENEAGERYYLTDEDFFGRATPPEGFIFQHSMFASQLVQEVLRLNVDAHGRCMSTHVGTGHSTYPGQLVFKMIESDDFTFEEAVLVAGQACERCLNALCYKYKVLAKAPPPHEHGASIYEGYPEESREYQESHTRCQFCDPAMEPKVVQPAPDTLHILHEGLGPTTNLRGARIPPMTQPNPAWEGKEPQPPASSGPFGKGVETLIPLQDEINR